MCSDEDLGSGKLAFLWRRSDTLSLSVCNRLTRPAWLGSNYDGRTEFQARLQQQNVATLSGMQPAPGCESSRRTWSWKKRRHAYLAAAGSSLLSPTGRDLEGALDAVHRSQPAGSKFQNHNQTQSLCGRFNRVFTINSAEINPGRDVVPSAQHW